MAQARYTVLVPSLPGLARAVYTYLTEGPIRVNALNVVQGHPSDAIVCWADESPEVDSHMKQVGTFTAEAAGVPTVDVIKEGKLTATWTMRNKGYLPKSSHECLSPGLKDSGDLPVTSSNT